MAKNKIVPIDYTSRDFNSIRSDLLAYVKRYYPDTYKDFNEASFGSLMLDTVSYVGDILSFYLDYQANESFLDTAIEYDNVIKHARQMGYKFKNSPMSHGICAFYILVPVASNSVVPDSSYMPTLMKGSRVSTSSGTAFTLNENVSFSNPDNEVVVAKVDTFGAPTDFAIKAYGRVVSGEAAEKIIQVGDYQRFLKVEIPGSNIGEILTVHDTKGNEYFEVDHLSQNIVHREVVNRATSRDVAPSIVKPFPVPRRFVVEQHRGITFLQFGYGSEAELTTSSVADPSELVLNIHGKNYISDTSFDPARLTSTDKFGVVPANTNLYVRYRINTNENVNVATNTIRSVDDPILYFENKTSLEDSRINAIYNSVDVNNEEPIVGDITMPSTAEIKRRALDSYATQGRAVTQRDYISSIYAMPSQFGVIKRCTVYRDSNDLKRNINAYIISEDASTRLTTTNSTIKSNLKTWLNDVKMMGDSIDILDAHVVNLGINFSAIIESQSTPYDVLSLARAELAEKLMPIHPEIGEPFYLTDVFKILKDTPGILDVVDVKVVIKNGGLYADTSITLDRYLSDDGRFLSLPRDYIWEIKYPYDDIVGIIV